MVIWSRKKKKKDQISCRQAQGRRRKLNYLLSEYII